MSRPPLQPYKHHEVIHLLESLLEKANAGEIQSIFITADMGVEGLAGAFSVGKNANVFTLLGAIESYKMAFDASNIEF
jgi:hypothetical protein